MSVSLAIFRSLCQKVISLDMRTSLGPPIARHPPTHLQISNTQTQQQIRIYGY